MFSPGSIRPKRWITVTPVSGQRRAASAADARDLGLCHARVMLELQGGERAALVAAQAREGDDRADVGPAGRQRGDLDA